MSLATVNTRVEAAIVHIDAGEWGEAETDLLAAKAALSILPDSDIAGSGLKHDRGSIDSLLETVRKKANATSGVTGGGAVRQNIKYKRVNS